MLICKNNSRPLPPTWLANFEKFLTFALIADSAIIKRLHAAAIIFIKKKYNVTECSHKNEDHSEDPSIKSEHIR